MNRRIREIVVLQLKQYPIAKKIVQETKEENPEIKRMRDWVRAIEEALSMLKRDAPHKASLMELLFFADAGDTPSDSCARRELLLDELHISSPTLYRWRDDIINAVTISAVETGAMSVYRPAAG